MNALERVRFRAGNVAVPSGAAPDSYGGGFMASTSASAGGAVDASLSASGALLLVILGIVIAAHYVAR